MVCWTFFSLKENYAENMKKIVGAVWDLPTKQHSQYGPFPQKLDCAIQQPTLKWLPRSFSYFQHNFVLIKKNIPQTTFTLTFLTHIIARIRGVSKAGFFGISIVLKGPLAAFDSFLLLFIPNKRKGNKRWGVLSVPFPF